jgi:hypothetical protein
MKKFLPLFLAASSLLQADIEIPQTASMNESLPLSEAPQTLQTAPKSYFTYLTLGVATEVGGNGNKMLKQALPDISYGWRKLNQEAAWDFRLGARYRPNFEMMYGQYSWFYVPTVTKGAYVGAGIQLGAAHSSNGFVNWKWNYSLTLDLPVTLGYLFSGKERHNFLQVQLSPLTYAVTKASQKRDPELLKGATGIFAMIEYGFGF